MSKNRMLCFAFSVIRLTKINFSNKAFWWHWLCANLTFLTKSSTPMSSRPRKVSTSSIASCARSRSFDSSFFSGLSWWTAGSSHLSCDVLVSYPSDSISLRTVSLECRLDPVSVSIVNWRVLLSCSISSARLLFSMLSVANWILLYSSAFWSLSRICRNIFCSIAGVLGYVISSDESKLAFLIRYLVKASVTLIFPRSSRRWSSLVFLMSVKGILAGSPKISRTQDTQK